MMSGNELEKNMFHARWPVVCAPSRTVSIYAPNIPGQCREGSPSLKSSVQSHIFRPSLHHPSDFVPGFVLSSNSTRRFSFLASGFLSLIADHHHSTVCVQILSAHTLWSISVVKSVIVIVSPSQVHLPAFMPPAS